MLTSLAMVRIADFDYELPDERIAQTPDRAARRGPAARRPGRARRRSTATSATCPSCSARATCSCVNDTRVIPARLAAAPRHRGSGRGAAARAARTPTGGRGRRSVRPARKLRVGEVLLVREATCRWCGSASARDAGDTFWVELVGDDDPARRCSTRHGEMPLPPYITRTPRPTPSATRPCTPRARLGGRADRRAALHPGAARPAGGRRRRTATGRAGRRARHVPADQRRRPARPPDAHRALPGAARDAGAPAGAAGRVVAVGTTAVRALESARHGRASSRAAPICSSTAGSTGRSSTC